MSKSKARVREPCVPGPQPKPLPDAPPMIVDEASFVGSDNAELNLLGDAQIVDLLWSRTDKALEALEARYGRWMYTIIHNILGSDEDSEECVNDVLLTVWNTVPPERPQNLRAYAGRIARNVALNRWQKERAAKRYPGTMLLLSELEECLPDLDADIDADRRFGELVGHINAYLHTLDDERQILFARRYWYAEPLEDIAADLHITPRNAAQMLFRVRRGLRKYLAEKGIYV